MEVTFPEEPATIRLLVCFLYQGFIPSVHKEISLKQAPRTGFSFYSPNGGTVVPFRPFVEKDPGSTEDQYNVFQHICFQRSYEHYSPDELRLMDYKEGRRFMDISSTLSSTPRGLFTDADLQAIKYGPRSTPTPPLPPGFLSATKDLLNNNATPTPPPFSLRPGLPPNPCPVSHNPFSSSATPRFDSQPKLLQIPTPAPQNLFGGSPASSSVFTPANAFRSLQSTSPTPSSTNTPSPQHNPFGKPSSPSPSSILFGSTAANPRNPKQTLQRSPSAVSNATSSNATKNHRRDPTPQAMPPPPPKLNTAQSIDPILTLLDLCLLAERISWPTLFNAAIRSYIINVTNLVPAATLKHVELIYSKSKVGSPLRKFAMDSLSTLGPNQRQEMMALAARNVAFLADVLGKATGDGGSVNPSTSLQQNLESGGYDLV